MATCPKCGYKLRLIDWRPDCPSCGVNIVYYGMEERLLDDADKAEAEHAHFQKRIDRLKASFIGSKLTILRIVLSLLPIAPLFLPLAILNYNGPFIAETTTKVTLLTLIDFFGSFNFDSLLTIIGSDIVGSAFIYFALSLVLLALSVVLILVSLLCLTMACGPKGNVRNITFNSLMVVFAAASIFCFHQFAGQIHEVFPDFISGSVGFGAYIYLALLVALLALNIIIANKGIEVKYKQCYIGGLKAEEYFELVEKGTELSVIREKMSAALAEKAEADAKAAAEKLAAEEAKKAEKATAKK